MADPNEDAPDFSFLNSSSDGSDASPDTPMPFPADDLPVVDEGVLPSLSTAQPRSRAAKKGTSQPIPQPGAKPTRSAPKPDSVSRAAKNKQTRRRPDSMSEDVHVDQVAASELSSSSANVLEIDRRLFWGLAGYSGLMTFALLLQLLGFWQPGGSHRLESLPDVAPLKANEFQLVPEGTNLPTGHELSLGESRRFGDLLFTATKVTVEPVRFRHMTTGQPSDQLTVGSALKLWFQIKNVSQNVAFPPWDVALMCHRSPPEGLAETTQANSWLQVTDDSGAASRILNLFHSPDSSFEIVDFHDRLALPPGNDLTSFVVSAETGEWLKNGRTFRWRLQLRKGVHVESGNAATTLVDVCFQKADVQQSG